jgi:hypothetical protein
MWRACARNCCVRVLSVLLTVTVRARRGIGHRTMRIVLLVLACLSIASPAYAYLDPGTGSMLVSAVIGVAAAVGLAVKMFWYRLLGLVRGKKREPRSGGMNGAPTAKE